MVGRFIMIFLENIYGNKIVYINGQVPYLLNNILKHKYNLLLIYNERIRTC